MMSATITFLYCVGSVAIVIHAVIFTYLVAEKSPHDRFQDPDHCVGVWILSPNRASGIRRLGCFDRNPANPPNYGGGRMVNLSTSTPLHAGVASTPGSPVSLLYTMGKFPDIEQ